MSLSIKKVVLFALMLASAGLSATWRPKISMADLLPPIDLKAMVPNDFGDWHEQLNVSTQIVDPQQRQTINKIYSETLSRTYVNSQGYRIMLSIAYGKNQSDALQLHKPEICYPAQGFTLQGKQPGTLNLLGRPVAAIRLKTSLGQRFEPITYWTVVGNHVTKSDIDKKLTEIRYALSGKIPDGMLIRMSSIDAETDRAHAIQSVFATEMIAAMEPSTQQRFAGVNWQD